MITSGRIKTIWSSLNKWFVNLHVCSALNHDNVKCYDLNLRLYNIVSFNAVRLLFDFVILSNKFIYMETLHYQRHGNDLGCLWKETAVLSLHRKRTVFGSHAYGTLDSFYFHKVYIYFLFERQFFSLSGPSFVMFTRTFINGK